MNHPRNNPYHDRLDLKQHAIEFTDPRCGSVNARSGLPDYCDFECPTLHGQQEKPDPHPLIAAFAESAQRIVPMPVDKK